METPTDTSFTDEHPFATDMAKSFAGAAVTTAGMLFGSWLVGTIKGTLDARKAEKVNPTEQAEE